MMERRFNGGPAFPVAEIGRHGTHGMSLRQWYAGRALSGLPLGDMTPRQAAEDAFEQADAMIAFEGLSGEVR